jgi:hypothetical protein
MLGAMSIDDLMQSEAAGLEPILEDPNDTLGEAYDDLRRSWPADVEKVLGFAYLVDDNEEKDIMETLNELYKSGMSLAQIKKAMKDWRSDSGGWIGHPMSDAISEYKDFINLSYDTVKKSNDTKSIKEESLLILDEIEKCMDFHLEWGFTMSIVGKFEKKNKAVTAIQSRHRGNNVREMLEKKGILYRDWTSHWKNKNKESIRAELVKVMIDEDMSGARKAEVMEEIEQFMTEKLMARKKKTRRRRGKKSRRKKSKRKKTKKKRSRYTKKSK